MWTCYCVKPESVLRAIPLNKLSQVLPSTVSPSLPHERFQVQPISQGSVCGLFYMSKKKLEKFCLPEQGTLKV